MYRIPTSLVTFVVLPWIYLTVPSAAFRGVFKNVALNKEASKSSANPGHEYAVAAFGVDGNTNQDFTENSCFVTGLELHPFWMVDLGAIYRIDHIKLYNRLGLYSEKARDIRTGVSMDGTNYTAVCFNAGQIPDIYTCKSDNLVQGRWVKLTIASNESVHLVLCEVEVVIRRELLNSMAFVKGTGSVLQTTMVASDIECAYHCYRNIICASVNVITSPNGIECQQLGSDGSVQTNDRNIAFWYFNG